MSSLLLPIANERGEQLIAVHESERHFELMRADFAIVLARRGDEFLLVRNAWRQVWELPGGRRDAGEHADACALRELAEESGQSPAAKPNSWRFGCWVEVDSGPNARGPRIAKGALYCAELDALKPFAPNEEVSAIGLWPADRLPPDTSAIDSALIQHFVSASRSGL